MISSIFHAILYRPLFNLFVELYNILPGHDVGLVILVITVLLRLVVYPLTSSSIKAQRSMQSLQPKLEALKKEYKDDQQKMAQATMELYKNNKINPLSSCLPLLIQLPILLALYWVMRDALTSTNLVAQLYSFISSPGAINPYTFGHFNLLNPNIILAILAGGAQFLQARTMSRQMPPKNAGEGSKDEGMAAMMNKQMLYMMPVMTVLIGLRLPSGLTLYWFWSTILMAAQQYYLTYKDKKAQVKDAALEGEVIKK
ncbi:MAG: YidC/Oxa1 family membrane protein insertase [Candidatus Magasanikbacteria bacterium]|nr:YidC/Oxa1 family membrane protein insertase [Candidatus Magasanikbacteria bacterium]